MGVKVRNSSKVANFLKFANETIASSCRTALTKLGEESVAKIRDRPASQSWIDHTGNLRSSIGYAIYDKGAVLISSGFDKVGDGDEGSAKGKKYVQELANLFVDTTVLVLVAGMDYASNVENIEGKDVLESTKNWAFSVVKGRVKNALDAAAKKINAYKL